MTISTEVYLAIECTKAQFCASEGAIAWARSYLRDPSSLTGPAESPEELWDLLHAPVNGRKPIIVRLDRDPDGVNGEPTTLKEGIGFSICAAGHNEMIVQTLRNIAVNQMIPFVKNSIVGVDAFFKEPLRFYAVLRRAAPLIASRTP